MRKHCSALLVLYLTTACGVSSTLGAPVPVLFGSQIRRLQNLVDQQYGANKIDVTKDFIGAHPGDIDPWFWVGDQRSAVHVKVLKCGSRCLIGWYLEDGSQPRLPDGGGVLFTGALPAREAGVVTLAGSRTRFGFYVDVKNHWNGPWVTAPGAVGTRRFFTNRKLNDLGLYGAGAIHVPFDGDVQALVFDVSAWAGTGTWLVCFEDRDTGGNVMDGAVPQSGGDAGEDDDGRRLGSDNDFDDVVFEVKADGATSSRALTFGALKLRYR